MQENEMTRDLHDPFEYDVAISFARADRTVAEQFAGLLRARSIRVYEDEYEAAQLGGGNFVNHVAELYRTRARYCVMLLSQHYPLKKWTRAERASAQEHALRDAHEYILPIQLDDTGAPGAAETTGYRDLRRHSMESIVDMLESKLAETKGRSGPPSQSHDLRSGNIPPKQGT
jgi:hypothetical protein